MTMFLDYEASGLERGSYPIQIGWCNENGVGESHYIIPKDEWIYWDFYAQQAIHGISRNTLFTKGKPIEIVIDLMEKALVDHEVYCDGGSHDKYWHQQLYGEDIPAVLLSDYFFLMHTIVKPFELNPVPVNWYQEIREAARQVIEPNHDALTDCRYLAAGYRIAMAKYS